jgi:ribosomal protein L29
MKKKELQELRTKTKDELIKLLESKNKELSQLNLDKAMRRLTNSDLLRHTKKDIARIQTRLNMKELTNG